MRESVHRRETKFNVTTRMNRHRKDVEYLRTNNAIAKHIQETKHKINWQEPECLK